MILDSGLGALGRREIANAMPDFLMRLVEVIGVKYLGADFLIPQSHININDAPGLGTFCLPFYAERPGDS